MWHQKRGFLAKWRKNKIVLIFSKRRSWEQPCNFEEKNEKIEKKMITRNWCFCQKLKKKSYRYNFSQNCEKKSSKSGLFSGGVVLFANIGGEAFWKRSIIIDYQKICRDLNRSSIKFRIRLFGLANTTVVSQQVSPRV